RRVLFRSHVGPGQHVAVDQFGTGIGVGLVREARQRAQPPLGVDDGTGRHQLFRGFRRERDATLARRALARHSNDHRHASLPRDCPRHRSESAWTARRAAASAKGSIDTVPALPAGAQAVPYPRAWSWAAARACEVALIRCHSCFIASSNGESTDRTWARPWATITASSSGETTSLRMPRRLTIRKRPVSGLIQAIRPALSWPSSSTRRTPCPTRRR